MNAPLRKVSEGRYEGTIGSTPVRVIRSTVGENRYGERSKAVEWKVHGGGRVITEGHGTMSGAISAAKRALGVEETSRSLKIKRAPAPAVERALRTAGYVVEVRGGDAIVARARDRHALKTGQGVRRTSHAVIVSKKDGSPMTANDVRRAREMLGAA